MTDKLEYNDIIVEKKGPIGYITINHPEKRNALVGGTIPQLQQAFLEMRDDTKIKVFILQGAEDNFCAGFYQAPTTESNILKPPEDLPEDVEWIKDVKDEPWSRYARDRSGSMTKPEGQPLYGNELFREELWDNPTPSIAKVDSFCLGAGLWIANQCDIVYATPNAIFSYPPIRRGASVVMGIVPPWILGLRQSMWMALTGQAITAQEALSSGLVTKIIPEDRIDAEVQKLAESIARVPPATHMFSKKAIHNYFENLGIAQAKALGGAFVNMTENSSAPGHYFDYYANIDKYGFREANRMQLEKHGGFDEVQDKEVARLRDKKSK